MARGLSTVGETETQARESVLKGHPELEILACEEIDLNDIRLRSGAPPKHWAVVFEDPDPSKFIQDGDPIGKVTREVRRTYQLMAVDPRLLTSGSPILGFTCPACGEEITIQLPPAPQRPGVDIFDKTVVHCPKCWQGIYRYDRDPLGPWRVTEQAPHPGGARPDPFPHTEAPARGERVDQPPPPGSAHASPRRACIFCGARDRKISKEHLWPKWLRPHVEGGESDPIGQSLIRATSTGKVITRVDFEDRPFDREISGACKPCNEGWMEDLEAAVRPVLIPMLQNEEVALDPAAQRTLARWATLKLFVAQHGHPTDNRTIPPERFNYFYADRRLPPGAQVWLARCNGAGAWPTDYLHVGLSVAAPGLAEPTKPNAYLVAFSVGYVAFFYWGHEFARGPRVAIGDLARHLVPIWPATSVVGWPPPGLLEAGLRDAVQRFPLRT